MSSFTKPLDVRIAANGRCGILLAELEYHVGEELSEDVIKVPIGFETDFCNMIELCHTEIEKHGSNITGSIYSPSV